MLALTVADRQYAAVARPTRLSVAPDEARHSLLANDPHLGRRASLPDELAFGRHFAGDLELSVISSSVARPGVPRAA